ncbi:ribose-5-phosphate isomerase RpiA [Candidatus Bathyarchaeota archaeon]|nr:ribose-5-phosphate isomerase RpiA [Candidatus Bathyarchaeota archaeon]
MSLEDAKKLAGNAAVDKHVANGMRVGVGSGSTIEFSIQCIANKLITGDLKDINCVCTSYQSTLSCQEHGIPVTTLDDPRVNGHLDVAIDGADEVDANLNLIKGGGGAHTQEKIIASAADQFIVVADERKRSMKLGEKWAIPIEIIPASLNVVLKRLKAAGAEPVLRMAEKKMGPVVTDNGNFIVDANFGIINNPADLECKLNCIPGVVENGLFCNMATVVYFGMLDGSLDMLRK